MKRGDSLVVEASFLSFACIGSSVRKMVWGAIINLIYYNYGYLIFKLGNE
jgi:tRNA G10  N-methylase Trm11